MSAYAIESHDSSAICRLAYAFSTGLSITLSFSFFFFSSKYQNGFNPNQCAFYADVHAATCMGMRYSYMTYGRFFIFRKICVALCVNVFAGICGQQRPRSDCASAQSDLGLYCPLTESLDTTECMNGQQRPGWCFAHAQDDFNPFNPFKPNPIKGTLANNLDPDQTPQNAASDQGLHCSHKTQEFLLNFVIIKTNQTPLIWEMGQSEEFR